jgi:hypothetical protein
MASTRITRTLSANGDKKLTISAWIKRSKISDAQYICRVFSDPNNQGGLYFTSGDNIEWFDYVGGAYKLRYITNAVYRDTSAWYHILAHYDNSLSSPEAKIYVNGVEQSLSTSTNYTQNQTTSWNNNYTFDIGSAATGTYFDGSMAHFYFIQNQKYAPTIFGETDSTSGIWKPITSPTIDYSATGSNSCFLKFENSGNMDLDSGSNNVSFTTSGNLTQNVDTPDNNFTTMNPLDNFYANGTFANGNNTVTSVSGDATYNTSTLGVSSGKWYWECKWSAQPTGSTNQVLIGITKRPTTNINFFLGMKAWTYAYNAASGAVLQSDSTIITYDTYSIGDIIGIALDLDNNRLYFSKNGVFQNSSNPANGTNPISIAAPDSTTDDSGAYFAGFGDGNANLQETGQFNFGNGYFGTTAVASANADGNGYGKMEYAVPSGYYTLNTKNIKEFG